MRWRTSPLRNFTKPAARTRRSPRSPFLSFARNRGWPPAAHERADKTWAGSIVRKTRGNSQQVNRQAWILYMLRFIFTGDPCGAWKHFGGLSAQLSLLSIAMHLAVSETAVFAISYDFA